MTSGTGSVLHVLTVHFNTPDLTSRLVKELPRESPHGRAVVVHVLDNCSTPANLCALRAGIDGLPGVTLDIRTTNMGFGGGMNALVSSSDVKDDDVIWLLNPDTRLRAGCLESLEDELDSGEFDLVSPLIYSGNELDPWIWYCGGSISVREVRVKHQLYGRRLADAPRRAFETEFITGAAPMMRASTFRTLGGFPSGYFLYWEDTYFSWSARERGCRLGVVPSAHLWHAVGASSGTGQSQTFYYWSSRNRFTFARDIGVSRRRLAFGKGGIETLRTIGKALRETEGRLPKAIAATRGIFEGFTQAGKPHRCRR
ncbi:glycosyltransferase family 2 protein [Mycolicibacterium hodleri]|uniref:glycosyltransferase family 2 protein n=1 Tax=Mycolicibacterium hodleri TaxID=49897 RepID=UPI0021F31575|nr:glycosyltransferase family 2 protein [Mycolicibacterium hodleri]